MLQILLWKQKLFLHRRVCFLSLVLCLVLFTYTTVITLCGEGPRSCLLPLFTNWPQISECWWGRSRWGHCLPTSLPPSTPVWERRWDGKMPGLMSWDPFAWVLFDSCSSDISVTDAGLGPLRWRRRVLLTLKPGKKKPWKGVGGGEAAKARQCFLLN